MARQKILATRPEKGFCRFRQDGKYICGAKNEHANWSWCDAHVRAHHAAKRAERKANPKPKTAKKDNIVQLPASVLAPESIPAEALAAFVSPALAEKAVKARRASKAPAKK